MYGDQPSLRVNGLRVELGGRTVVANVSFELRPGPPTILFGPNGAGKTTLVHAIAGFLQASGGTIQLAGRSVTNVPAFRRARLGIVPLFQRLRLFRNMTAEEHIVTAMMSIRHGSLCSALFRSREQRRDEFQAIGNAREMLETVGLGGHAGKRPGELSYGQQKVLALCRALATRPSVLLLDEPFAGVAPVLKQQIIHLVQDAAASGVIVVVVEHDMATCADLPWNALFMERGELRLQGQFQELIQRDEVVTAYLGSPTARVTVPTRATPHAFDALAIRGLTAGYDSEPIVKGLSFQVQPGQVFGLVGLNGSGKTTVLNAIFGFAKVFEGDVRLGMQSLSQVPPWSRARAGILYVPQSHNLFDSMTLKENLDLVRWLTRTPTGNGHLPKSDIAVPVDRPVSSLSGGERQSAIVARLQLSRPRLVMLDEPSIGLSPDQVRATAERVRAWWHSCGAPPMLIAEQNVPFLLELATVILIVRDGVIVAHLPASTTIAEQIQQYLGLTGNSTAPLR